MSSSSGSSFGSSSSSGSSSYASSNDSTFLIVLLALCSFSILFLSAYLAYSLRYKSYGDWVRSTPIWVRKFLLKSTDEHSAPIQNINTSPMTPPPPAYHAPPKGSYATPLFKDASAGLFKAGKNWDAVNVPTKMSLTKAELDHITALGKSAWTFTAVNQTSGSINVDDGTKIIIIRCPSGSDVSTTSNIELVSRNFTPKLPVTVDYFEVQLFSKEKNDTVVALGICTSNYPSFRLCDWNLHSVGMHSDDGRLFHNDAAGGKD